MKNAKPKSKPVEPVEEDPTLRMDILAKRLLEKVMKDHCKDPALIFVYARFKPGIDQAFEDFLGPVKTRRRRVK